MSQEGIFSSRVFNMSGFEIAKDGKIIPEGQIFFGADFVLKNNDEYTLIIQHVRNLEQIQKIKPMYGADEWAWVVQTYRQVFDVDLANASRQDIVIAAEEFLKIKSKFLRLVIADAEKEFAELSRCGFGQDGAGEDVEKDFCRVRGLYEENKFVRQMKNNLEKLQQRVERLRQKLSAM